MKKIIFFSEISYQTLKRYGQNGRIYSNLTQRQIIFYMQQWPMIPDHGTQYEETPSNHHGGMCNEGLDPSRIMSYKFQTQATRLVSSFLDTSFFQLESGRPRVVKIPW